MNPIKLESQNQAKNIPVVLSSSPIKIWGKTVKVFMTYDWTYKQTNNFNLRLKFEPTVGNSVM